MFNRIHQNLALFVPKQHLNSEICEISGQKYNFFEKTNPIFPGFQPKNHDSAKSKPNFNPILSKLRVLSVLCGENHTFLCKTNPNFLVSSPKTAIWRKNEPKTNPNKAKWLRCQNEPIPCNNKAL